MTPETVEALFKSILGRPVWNDAYTRHLVALKTTCAELILELRSSEELGAQVALETAGRRAALHDRLDGPDYLTPQHLQTSPKLGGRCLLIGACLLDPWTDILSVTHPEWAVEVVTFNNVDGLPPRSAQDMGRIDFQILQIPMRFVLPDHVYFGMLAGSQREEMVWDDCVERVRLAFHALTEYARTFSTPAFMLSLLTPQRHSLGRFGDTGSRAEPVGLVRALNDEIARLCSAAGSVFFYDFEQTISLYGKKYFQDDIASHSNHGGLLGSIDIFPQMDRLHPLGDAVALYGPRHTPIVGAVFADIVGAYQALQQTDAVKLVVFDLDDTLWRGVAAESDDLGWEMVEGWPLGMVEAVAALHGRGVLVALVSKNDEARAEQVWRHLYQHHFPWESFFAREISWGDKAEAIGRIIRKANILPSAALFVDDNPIERERAKGALPDLRILDAPVAEWKRILLWSPQTQPAVLTEEARSRSRSLNARPAAPAAAESREAFLERLNVQVSIETVDSMEAPAFKRVFELLNKTNQFNTTGRRWKLPEARALFDAGGMMLTARVSDAYSDYGLTAIAVVSGPEIVQMVMSCRVFGLGVEGRLLQTALVAIAASGAGEAFGAITPTGRNGSSLKLFEAAGFVTDPPEPGEADAAEPATTTWRIALPAAVGGPTT